MKTSRTPAVLRALLPVAIVTTLAAYSGAADARGKLREGKEVVSAVCAGCHQEGKDGAPKIGDRAAWTPRLAKGLEDLIDAAVNGHGGMPSRGGMPQLERDELRAAILYMFNSGLPPVPPPPEYVAPDPRHKTLAGTDIYFGVMQASALRASQPAAGQGGIAKVSVPTGRDYYHLNVALADSRSGAAVKDAQVTLRVSDGMSVQSKSLSAVAANDKVSYGEFFKLSSGSAYNVQAEISRPGLARPIVTNFEYRAP
jgi:cytochrome c5